ncbi:SDR family NAD(P)-dependent oxidoreductase [Lentzea sp. NPDC051213]|uniref:SDR family NAD(P)-dependent oxidoreductase n=1 Tax=Lentzea sp. NPDC051213 TaxID=3364126 RepID=UPI00378CFF49
MNEPVAVVGIGCRYPDAANPAELWHTVLGKRQAFRRLPPDRLPAEYLGDGPDSTYVTHAGLLNGWTFDRDAFHIPGRLHRAADTTHWLALDTAAKALADAGFPGGEGLDRDRSGVVIGNSLTGELTRASTVRLRLPFLRGAASAALQEAGVDPEVAERVLESFGQRVRAPFPEPDDETLSGALANTIAGRVCNHFDFHGTGYTVDGACASSLIAIMTACRALRDGELDFVLAGGVDVSLDPFELVGFARLGALAVDRMRVYDASPTGFLPGEGCGIVALMRASDAARQGLRSYATVLGWGMSSDGAGGLTRPGVPGQVLALHRAYAMSGRSTGEVALVEGHGTGTAVGDRVELEVLRQVFGGSGPVALGSVKANIGHTKAAAGAAGFIKAALAAHHQILPPTTGCDEPHELLAGSPVHLLADARRWPSDRPLAGVSSMGFGGINAHIVLAADAVRPSAGPPPPLNSPGHELLALSAGSPDSLAATLGFVAGQASRWSRAELLDVAATAHLEFDPAAAVRVVLVAGRPEELETAALAAVECLRGSSLDGPGVVVDHAAGFALGRGRAGRVGLMFPGQAAPVRAGLSWWSDRVAVPEAPAGRDVAEGAAGTRSARPLVVRDAAAGTESAQPSAAHNTAEAAAAGTELAQPLVVRQSLAGLAWLAALGCRPTAATGHSLGEISALAWAEALPPTTALRLAGARGRLMADLGTSGTGMAGLACSAQRATDLVAGTTVEIAGLNAPDQTAVSGPADEIRTVVQRCRAAGITATPLPVSHGFHSAAMLPVREPFRDLLKEFPTQPPTRPVISTVTGAQLNPDADLATLLEDQLTSPVRFLEAVTELRERCDLLVEVGPGDILSTLARGQVPCVSLDCGGSPRRHAVATAALVAAGAADVAPWFTGRAHRTLPINAPITLLTGPCERPAETAGAPTEPVVTSVRESLPALREHLSRRLELTVHGITAHTSLLADLHLNSLQVAQVFTAVAAELNRTPPDPLPALAEATVGELARMLDELPRSTGKSDVDGVRPWVRAFTHVSEPHSRKQPTPTRWHVHAPPGSWVHTLATDTGTPGMIGYLPLSATPEDVAGLLREIGTRRPERLLLLHHRHPAAAAAARAAAVELGCATTVAELPEAADDFDTALATAGGYLELDRHGERAALGALPLDADRPIPLAEGDVLLVTGGVAGITALCAEEIARRTGCIPVVLGRSEVTFDGHYITCDVTDPDAVAAAVAQASALGPVRGLVHGAAVNEPLPLERVTAESLRKALRPKVDGMRTLLRATSDPTLVLGFGSVIGAFGLAGQAEYGVANDWMRAELEDWAAKHPACRTHVLEWSAWSGLGMAERMEVVASLTARGVRPITPDEGVAALMAVLESSSAPVTVLLTGRMPASPTVQISGQESRLTRFGESVRSSTPGVELVVEATLAAGSDPYLADHVIDGVPVLPAVMCLEAAAQTASSLTGDRDAWSLSEVVLRAPVTVESRRTIRVAALTDGNAIDVRVTDDLDGFGSDRSRMRVTPAPAAQPAMPATPPAVRTPNPFYDSVLFHSGRFRRVLGYDELSAFRVRAWVNAGEDDWFGEFHSSELVLGDPGVHDACIHALLPCVPHRRALPVAVERFTCWRRPEGPVLVTAREREHTVDEYLFDVDVHDPAGQAVARWEGLRLRATAAPARRLPMTLVGPLLTRRLIELGLADDIELVARPGTRAAGAAKELATRWLGREVRHNASNALVADGVELSASYTRDHVLLALSSRPVGVDWQAIGDGAVPLGSREHRLALDIAARTGEPDLHAMYRVWTIGEAVRKAGITEPELTDVTPDGLVVFGDGETYVLSARVDGVAVSVAGTRP